MLVQVHAHDMDMCMHMCMCTGMHMRMCMCMHMRVPAHTLPVGGADSFCCPGLSGSATYPASSTYKSVNDDNYSLRPGLSQQQVAKSCENSIDAWSNEEFHNDNFEHTSTTTFSSTNYKTEVRPPAPQSPGAPAVTLPIPHPWPAQTAAMVFWCHNLLTACQLSLANVNIGTKSIGNTTTTSGATVVEIV